MCETALTPKADRPFLESKSNLVAQEVTPEKEDHNPLEEWTIGDLQWFDRHHHLQ